MDFSEEKIRAYALKNAIKHGGKARESSVLAGLFAEGLKKEDVGKIISNVKKIVGDVNSRSLEEQKAEFEKLKDNTSERETRTWLPELPNVSETVVMRFAPFPSGPLHIGNARPLILNDEYAKHYQGKLLLVMDDTIGSLEKRIDPEAYKLIIEGVKWLGVNYDRVLYKSDRIEVYYEYAEEMIKKGYMYVCTCPIEKMREMREKGIACECRDLPPEENLKRWKEMFHAKEGSMCVRLKTDMRDPDPAFRDRVMFKIAEREHPRLGTKYRVYPTLEFSWAIDDHAFGITHILRGVDLSMESRVEKFIWDIFKWKHPEIIYTGHFAIEGVKISKSKGAKEVRSGLYSGWDDPRTWSLQSLRARGILPEAIRRFVIDMGVKKSNVKVPVERLYAINREMLKDKGSYFFVENPVKIKIHGCPEKRVEIPLNRKGGFKSYKLDQMFFIPEKDFELLENGIYRLAHLLTFRASKPRLIDKLQLSFVSEDIEEEPLRSILWIPTNDNFVKAKIVMPDASERKGIGESFLRKVPEGEIVYFDKIGFCRLYKKGEEFEFRFAHS